MTEEPRKSDIVYAEIQREIVKTMADMMSRMAQEMLKDDGVYRHPQPAPPKRTLRVRFVTWHWRVRERIANAIFSRSDDADDE